MRLELFTGLPRKLEVWMSHGDEALELPAGFKLISKSPSAVAGIEKRPEDVGSAVSSRGSPHQAWNRDSAQFRLEDLWCQTYLDPAAFYRCRPSKGAQEGWHRTRYLRSFRWCGFRSGRGTGGSGACASGGKSRLTCVFVNNGVLRKNEFEKVQKGLRDKLGLHLVAVDATDRFLKKLAGVTDPEKKRKIIGNEFIEVFDEEAQRIEKERERRVAGAGHALSRCDRVAFGAGPVADHQVAPQRRRLAGEDEAQADRAAERIVQR